MCLRVPPVEGRRTAGTVPPAGAADRPAVRPAGLLAFVKNRADAAPWLFLVEAQKNRKTGLRVEPDVLISAGAALYGR